MAASRAMKSMRGAVRQRKVSFRKRCGKISVKEGARLEELGLVGAPRLNAPGGLSPAIPTVADYIHRLSVPSTLSAVGSPNSVVKIDATAGNVKRGRSGRSFYYPVGRVEGYEHCPAPVDTSRRPGNGYLHSVAHAPNNQSYFIYYSVVAVHPV